MLCQLSGNIFRRGSVPAYSLLGSSVLLSVVDRHIVRILMQAVKSLVVRRVATLCVDEIIFMFCL